MSLDINDLKIELPGVSGANPELFKPGELSWGIESIKEFIGKHFAEKNMDATRHLLPAHLTTIEAGQLTTDHTISEKESSFHNFPALPLAIGLFAVSLIALGIILHLRQQKQDKQERPENELPSPRPEHEMEPPPAAMSLPPLSTNHAVSFYQSSNSYPL